MRKVNSLYIEIEAVKPQVWHLVVEPLRKALASWGITIIRWETGIIEVPDPAEDQQDMFGS